MAFVFNSGMGGVICDQCRILIDQNLGAKEYKEFYKDYGEKDLCMKCKEKNKKIEQDNLNDGWRN